MQPDSTTPGASCQGEYIRIPSPWKCPVSACGFGTTWVRAIFIHARQHLTEAQFAAEAARKGLYSTITARVEINLELATVVLFYYDGSFLTLQTACHAQCGGECAKLTISTLQTAPFRPRAMPQDAKASAEASVQS